VIGDNKPRLVICFLRVRVEYGDRYVGHEIFAFVVPDANFDSNVLMDIFSVQGSIKYSIPSGPSVMASARLYIFEVMGSGAIAVIAHTHSA
jgi:hypothetical protein